MSLAGALAKAHEEYKQRNSKSFQAWEESNRHLPGGNTRTVLHAEPFPLTFVRGDGCHLQSLDGHTYTDFLGEYTTGIYGHNNSQIREAVLEALSNGWNYGGCNVYERQLAKIVCERFSPTMEMVRFTNSGTEANLMAIGAAVNFTGRKKILVFSNGYHGSGISFPLPRPARSMNIPHDFIEAPFNNIHDTLAILDQFPPESLAAVLVEPVQGSGGVNSADPAFLHFLRESTTRSGAVLIFDEVMTSRLSYRGMGFKLGIKPDLMTLGKWVGGGMSFGAFGGRRDIMSLFDPRAKDLVHSGTFNNNVISMSAGVVGCKLLTEPVLNELNATGDTLRQKLDQLFRSYQVAATLDLTSSPRIYINGVGSMLFMHFSAPSEDEARMWRALFYHHMLKNDIYLASKGFMALSIGIEETAVNNFVYATKLFIKEHLDMLQPD